MNKENVNNDMKLQKFLALAGICSRRSAEAAIVRGDVTVDGVTATLGDRVTGTEDVLYCGKKVAPPEEKVYYMLNKPVGYICTMDEQFGRKALPDLIGHIKERVYPVGRLDMDSEGLLLLTNDGDMTLKLTHPRYHIEKTYTVTVRGRFGEDELDALTHMTTLEGEPINPVKAVIISSNDDATTLGMKLNEGKNRQIRRMFTALGRPVSALRRDAVGDIVLGTLPRGKKRLLTEREIEYLKEYINDKTDSRSGRKR